MDYCPGGFNNEISRQFQLFQRPPDSHHPLGIIYLTNHIFMLKLIALCFVMAVSMGCFSQKKIDSKTSSPNAGPMAVQKGYHKFEISVGYSHNFTKRTVYNQTSSVEVINPSSGNTTTISTGYNFVKKGGSNGFDVAATYNFSRFLGATINVSANYRHDTLFLPGGRPGPDYNTGQILAFDAKAPQSTYSFMLGLQVKDNSLEKKLKPFVHALFGVAQQRLAYHSSDDDPVRKLYFSNGSNKIRLSGFAMGFGGGLDIPVSRRIDIRVIQFDYNLIFLKGKVISGSDADGYVSKAELGYDKYTITNYHFGAGLVVHDF